jgi:hypothetical protein
VNWVLEGSEQRRQEVELKPNTFFRPAIPMLCGIAAFAGTPAKSDPFVPNMPHSPIKGPAAILEGSGLATYSITVTNSDKVDPIVLDFALVTTIPVAGDATDVINFPTVVTFPAVIAAGKKGTFVYTVKTGDNAFDGTDSGVTDFSFSTEYSVITGAANTPSINLGPTGGVLILQGQQSGNLDPTTLAALLGCLANPGGCANPPLNDLYPPSANNGNPVFDATAFKLVTVFDVPEPSTWALMLLGFAGLGAVLRRRPGADTAADAA